MNQSNKSDNLTDRAWKFFASVKLSVVLLLALAATSVIGTVIPQNAAPAMYIQKYGETLYTLFDALDFFDMYHAWWFRLLLALLTINIIVCSINRLQATWKIIFPKKVNFQADRFRKSKDREEWEKAASLEDLQYAYENYLGRHFRQLTRKEKKDGHLLFAEKGRWTRLGVYAVHFSILLLVIGGLVGSLFGFEGYANIPEGESVKQIDLKNKDAQKTLPFAIRCDEFSLSHYESGMPKEYRSTVSLLNDGKVVHQADIRVNDPLHYQGISIFQSSYGRVPDDSFTLVFTDPESGMEYRREAAVGAEVDLPGGKGSVFVQDFSTSFNFRGHNIGEAFLLRLMPADSEKSRRSIVVPVNYPRFDRMRGGDFVISIKDVDFGYSTGLQVSRDPGVPIVYAGFIIIIIGCYITFFMRHKQVCVELTKGDGRTEVMLACVSGKNRPGLRAVTRRLAEKMKSLPISNER